MTQSSNSYPYAYEDECISYKSLFPSFSKKDFDKLDEIYNQLDIDCEIKKFFSEYKINTTEDQAALHHVYRSAHGQKISSVHESYYEVAKSSISECIKFKEKLINKKSPALQLGFFILSSRTLFRDLILYLPSNTYLVYC